jgi:serine protease AprX
VDVTAPGTHVLGLRVPGSVVDLANPIAVVGTRFLRGSGTSQATAVTSGAIALLLQARPELTPNQVKWAITHSATPLPKGTAKNSGAGLLNARSAFTLARSSALPAVAAAAKGTTWGTGTGSLELARGGSHLITGFTTISTKTSVATTTDLMLTGERDIFGTPWNPASWAPATLAGTAWTAGRWRGNVWTGGAFNTKGDWASATWRAPSWAGVGWSGRSWVGRSWVNGAWVGSAWVNSSWSGRSWVDATWSSNSWN